MTNTCTSTAGLLPVVLFASAYVAADSVAAQSRGSDPFEPARRVLQERCVACHAAPEPEAGLALGSWGAVMSGSDYGEAVIPFDSENSLLVEMITKLVDGPHPGEQGAPILVEREIETLRTWIDKGARSPDGAIPFADATELLYVTNQGEATVSVIDMETNMVVRTVDLTALGFSEGSMPHHIAVEPDGSYWYVSLIVANSILKFDRHNNLVGQVAFDRPGLLALDPTGDLLFAARSMISANPPQ
ncbi:MAG: c-type cytochrome domain-containing protein, partial [Gemmatimonadales bacterium]